MAMATGFREFPDTLPRTSDTERSRRESAPWAADEATAVVDAGRVRRSAGGSVEDVLAVAPTHHGGGCERVLLPVAVGRAAVVDLGPAGVRRGRSLSPGWLQYPAGGPGRWSQS